MELKSLLEQDKERLLAALEGAKTQERALAVMADELDSLLLRCNEQCQEPAVRSCSAAMVEAARGILPAAAAHGEPVVWEYRNGENMERKSPLPAALFIAGMAGALLSGLLGSLSLWVRWGGLAVCLGCAYLSASLDRRKADSRKGENVRQMVEIPVDARRSYSGLLTLAGQMDRILSRVQAEEEERRRNGQGQQTQEEIDLLASLLEAAASGDGEYALDQLAGVKYYLHRKGIEAVDYDGSNDRLFDKMPAKQPGTIRPALVQGDRVLKKGLAAG